MCPPVCGERAPHPPLTSPRENDHCTTNSQCIGGGGHVDTPEGRHSTYCDVKGNNKCSPLIPVCEASGKCENCKADDNCEVGLYCSGSPSKKCRSGDAGDHCTTNSQCIGGEGHVDTPEGTQSMYCAKLGNNKCSPLMPSCTGSTMMCSTCKADDNCQPGLYCSGSPYKKCRSGRWVSIYARSAFYCLLHGHHVLFFIIYIRIVCQLSLRHHLCHRFCSLPAQTITARQTTNA